ncbi:MAG: helix-turn-helix domain-containing protein [Myxococcota bacterium]
MKSDNQPLVLTTLPELQKMVREAVRQELETSAKARPELISTDEMAQRVGVSPDTLRKWVAGQGCPVLRAGRKLRFREPAVLEWLEDRGA